MGMLLNAHILQEQNIRGFFTLKKKLIIEEMTWVDFQSCIENTKLVILPVGAIEAYGAHLPLGSDSIVSYSVAKKVAEKVECLVAPPINFGYSEELMGFPGTISISSSTLSKLLWDIVDSLQRHGIKEILFLCGHIGNLAPIKQVAFDAKREFGITSMVVDWWRYVYEVNKEITNGIIPEGHASEVGTSVLMYLFPDLVEMEKAVKELPPENMLELPNVEVFTYFHHLSKSSVWGDPASANQEKGGVFVNKGVDIIVDFIGKWLS